MRSYALPVLVVLAAMVVTGCQTHYVTDPAKESTSGCVGPGGGDLKIARDAVYTLTDGVDVTLGSTMMAAEHPEATLNLSNVSPREEQSAEGLRPGDTFEAGGKTFEVTLVCGQVVEVGPA